MRKVLVPGLVTGIVILIVSLGMSFLFNAVFPSVILEYGNTAIFRPWDDPLMSIFFLHPFVLGIVLAWIWEYAKPVMKGTSAGRGIQFGLAYWLVTVPGMIVTYSSFQVSLLMVLTWSVSILIQALAAGAVLARMNDGV